MIVAYMPVLESAVWQAAVLKFGFVDEGTCVPAFDLHSSLSLRH